MRIEPNVSMPMRAVYIVAGSVLIAIPFWAGLEGWVRLAVPVLGGVSIVVGLVGW